MQDILLKATHEAQSIIEECLNGYNFGQTFSALRSHLDKIADREQRMNTIKADVLDVRLGVTCAMENLNVGTLTSVYIQTTFLPVSLHP